MSRQRGSRPHGPVGVGGSRVLIGQEGVEVAVHFGLVGHEDDEHPEVQNEDVEKEENASDRVSAQKDADLHAEHVERVDRSLHRARHLRVGLFNSLKFIHLEIFPSCK